MWMKIDIEAIKRDKKYYVILIIIMFVCFFIVNMLNLYNIIGFAIVLITNIIFNVIWNGYHNDKGE